jgi:hypothetical protein
MQTSSKIKCVITQGCSFTQVPSIHDNWPVFLRNYLDVPTFFDGAGSAGNDFISRRAIYRIYECLKTVEASELLVGIMWSGVSRKSFYLTNPTLNYNQFDYGIFFSNPNCITQNNKNHYLVFPFEEDELSSIYYKHFYDEVGSVIETIENILRVQWFLKLHKIKYFFTTYHSDSLFSLLNQKYISHPDVKYLYDQIDFANFLPCESMSSWISKDTNFKYQPEKDNHPTTEMSKEFTYKVIIPHLKSMGYID